MEETITVLLIDDQAIIGESIRRMLAPEKDIKYHFCSDPTKAFHAAKDCNPTVILQDLVMPEMEGLTLLRFLRFKNSPTVDTPVIVLSSKEDPVIKAKAFELGANDYLVKLPDRVELIARVRYHSKAYNNLIKRKEAEGLLKAENERQSKYILQVDKVSAAAVSVEQDKFDPDCLNEVAAREDELGKLATIFTNMVASVKAREKELTVANTQLEALLQAYGRFVPREYLKFLHKQSITEVELGDHVSKVMAVMFSDLRSFTTISQGMTPKENFDFVNAYLKRVSPEIRNHNGFIVKYLGDGMMAVFPDGSDDAIQAGIAKLKQVEEYNKKRVFEGRKPVAVGIGVHVGHMMVGMVGEANRMQGDAFSDNVNLTSRLEGLTKFYGVSFLISEQGIENLSNPSQYQLRFLDRAIVKGRTEAIAVYEVLDAEVEEMRVLKIKTQPNFDRAIEHYREGDFPGAKEYLERMLETNPDDKTALLYFDRVKQLIESGKPKDWQGVWTFTEK